MPEILIRFFCCHCLFTLSLILPQVCPTTRFYCCVYSYLLVQCLQCNCVVFTDRQFSVPVITRISWNIHGVRSCGYFLLVFLFDSWICMIKYVWSLSEWRVIHKQRKQQQHPNPIPLVVLVSVLASLCLVNDQWVG